ASPVRAADTTHAGFDAKTHAEAIATIVAHCDACDWGTPGRETVLLEVTLDGAYSQHVALMRGPAAASYKVLLGDVTAGHHEVGVVQDRVRSAPRAGRAHVTAIDVQTVAPDSRHYDWISRAPVLRARPGTVEQFSDFPLLMYAERDAGSEGPA